MTPPSYHYTWQHGSSPKYHYLHNTFKGGLAAKLYYMHGRWNISVKERDNADLVRRLCEEHIVNITTKALEGT